jgi:hypothetical protein
MHLVCGVPLRAAAANGALYQAGGRRCCAGPKGNNLSTCLRRDHPVAACRFVAARCPKLAAVGAVMSVASELSAGMARQQLEHLPLGGTSCGRLPRGGALSQAAAGDAGLGVACELSASSERGDSLSMHLCVGPSCGCLRPKLAAIASLCGISQTCATAEMSNNPTESAAERNGVPPQPLSPCADAPVLAARVTTAL